MNEQDKAPRGRAVRHDGWTETKRKRFLAALAETGNVAEAARVAGKGKSTAYVLRRSDPAFAEAWDIALEALADQLEAQLRDRVLNGVETVLHYQGKVFGTQRIFSDRLAVYLLSRLRPVRNNPLTAIREQQRPAAAICDKLAAAALRTLKARLGAGE